MPGVTHNAVGSAGITFFTCVSFCIASVVIFLFLLQLCKRHLFCCFMLIDLCVKFENKKKAETLKVLTLFFFSFLIYKRMCHVGICFVIECSIMSVIIYIIFHAV